MNQKDRQSALCGEREREFLCKLEKLSQKNRDAALTMWGFFIDGMAAQERLTAQAQDSA